jgi:Glycosyl hydrolase family 9./N-terminal ig-like domain of cellulase.
MMNHLLLVRVALAAISIVPFCAGVTAHAQTYLRVNQVGYETTAPKIAIAFSKDALPEQFTIKEGLSEATVFTGKLTPVSGEWGEFSHHAEINLTSFSTQGRFFIQVGAARSALFIIHPKVASALPDQLLEFMRQQRCGYNPFVDAVCHPFDGRTAFGPLRAGTYLDASGGWHDAGDQLKYLLTSSNATAQLLLAYQMAVSDRRSAQLFADIWNRFGQPGANGLPDILDEARWGLEWMLKLHPAKDQLYHQVADDRDHQGFRLPQNETVDYGWGGGSYRVVYFADGRPQGLKEYQSESTGVANLAGRYAAAMALGYQIWIKDPSSRAFAEKVLDAASEVYELGQLKEGVQQGNSYGAPYRYEEITWADDMEWGAAELFRATKKPGYLRDAKRYAAMAGSESWMGQEQTKHYQYYPFMNIGHFRLYDLVDIATKRQLAAYYREGIERCVKMGLKNPFEVGVPFIWCSNNLVVALVTQCAMYERMTGARAFRDFAAKQFDWLLGRNPWGVSMFTVIPKDGTYPHDVHLFPNALLKREVRGGLVDGPVYRKVFENLRGVFIRKPDPFADFQDERAVYHDDINDYSTNEPTMDGTASAVLMFVIVRG